MLSNSCKGLHRSLAEYLLAGETWGIRGLHKAARDLSESFISLPPVSFDEESGAPSVLQWLRRRGPPVSESCRNRLVREKRVRLLEGGHLRQIGASRLLHEGAQLLLPKTAIAEWHTPNKPRMKDWRTERLEEEVLQHLRGAILHKDRELLIINKPAGLPVQGGDAICVSVDSLLPQLTFGASERPRLVHRLDRGTSGALVLARTRDSATRLSKAFRQASATLASMHAGAEASSHEHTGPGVQKLYLAIVEEGERLEDRGFVGPTVGQTQGLPATKTTNSAQAAKAEEEQLVLTQYTTLARCQEKFALLALQPITGRKHQLRKACARVLHSPILGDGRYALLRSADQQWFQARLTEAPAVPGERAEQTLGMALRCNRHLQLHCFQVCVQDADGFQIRATAPLPAHMRKAIRMLFKDLPEDLDAGLTKLSQLSDFSSRESLDRALTAARHSVHSRQRAEQESRKPKRSLVLPRTSHVELPADPKFQHLASYSTPKKGGVSGGGVDCEGDSSDDSDSDDENRGRKPRWSSLQKREAKEERRALKKARREREKARRKALQTPLQWEE